MRVLFNASFNKADTPCDDLLIGVVPPSIAGVGVRRLNVAIVVDVVVGLFDYAMAAL